MRSFRTAALVAILAAGVFSSVARGAYLFTNFDGPADNSGGTTVNGINSLGQVVGFSSNAGGTTFTNFIRNTNGTFTTLTTVDSASATAMSNGLDTAGDVVGTNGSGAFLLGGTTLTTLDPANPGHTASEAAFGINDGGAIVGQYTDTQSGTTPGFFRSSGGTFTVLNPTNDTLVANAQSVNNNGMVAGFYSTNASPTAQHGFLYNSASPGYTLISDPSPGLPLGQSVVLTQFLGINDNNMAVGYYQTTNGSQHGFLYDANTKTYTFLDDPNAPTSGVTTTQITGINDSSQIAGFYVDSDGVQHGFLAAPAPIPLPPAAWSGLTLLAGLGAIGIIRRRHAAV